VFQTTSGLFKKGFGGFGNSWLSFRLVVVFMETFIRIVSTVRFC